MLSDELHDYEKGYIHLPFADWASRAQKLEAVAEAARELQETKSIADCTCWACKALREALKELEESND